MLATKPSGEQQAYLNQGPNFPSFMRNFSNLMDDGNAFIRQHEEMQDLQENLMDCCMIIQQQRQHNCLAESLANGISITK